MEKNCSRCGVLKPLASFNKKAGRKDGLRSECKACESAYRAAKLSCPIKRQWEQERLKLVRESATAEQKAAIAQRMRNYYKSNKDAYRKRVMDRNARKKQATPSWADSEWEQFVIREIYHLACLRQEMLGIEMHVDHEVPLKSEFVCGLHCAANLQVVTAEYNRNKNNLFWEHMP